MKKAFVLLSAWILAASVGFAQWDQLSGYSNEGNANAIVFINDTMIVSHHGNVYESYGLYNSIDYGATWSSNTNLGLAAERLIVHGGHLYAGTWGEGVRMSTDRGESWESKNNGLPYDWPVLDLISQQDTLYVCGNSGIYRSDDNCDSWENIGLFGTGQAACITKVGNTLISSFSHDSGWGTYRSTDQGDNWTLIETTSGLSDGWLRKLSYINGTVYASATNTYKVYVSDDEGISWSLAEGLDILGSNAVFDFIGWGNTVYAATSNGVFKSMDEGLNWTSTGCSNTISLAINNEMLYAGCGYNGLWEYQLPSYGTEVSGLIAANTTWNTAGSPYFVIGNIAVDEAVTLVINPGVEVLFEGPYSIQVQGTLLAEGTENDSIRFTSGSSSPGEDDWEGITFQAGSEDCSLKYTRIEYADYAIEMDGASPLISHSLIQHNEVGIHILWNSGDPYIENNSILYNSFAGIAGSSYDRTDIIANDVSYNYYGYYRFGAVGDFYLNDNTFSYNVGGVIFEASGSVEEMSGNTVHGNSDIGMQLEGSPFKVIAAFSYNTISDNNTGLLCWDFQGEMIYNEFSLNNVAIRNGEGSYPPDLSMHFNCFDENSLNYKHLRTENSTLPNNWWGTTDSLTVAALIHDFYDDFTLGKVFTDPILLAPDCSPSVGTENLIVVPASKNLHVHPNPSDLSGLRIRMPESFSRPFSLSIRNVNGKEVFRNQVLSLSNSGEYVLPDLSWMVNGIYLLRIMDEKGNSTYCKLLKN